MGISAFRLVAARIIPIRTDAITPDELSLQLPRGLYTTFTTNHNGTSVLGLTKHLDRLYTPAQTEGIHPSVSPYELCQALSKLALDRAPSESRFRILLSASDGKVYIILQSFKPIPQEIYKKGVKAITADLFRHDPRRKDSSFIAASQAERLKVSGDVYEVLLTKKGRIYEGMTSNFYVVKNAAQRGWANESDMVNEPAHNEFPEIESGATLITARNGILLGVTRRAILHLARGQGMFIKYRAPSLAESFSEAFITSSSRGVVPVVSIDNIRVGEGIVGTWTRRLVQAYGSYVEKNSEPITPST
jgi:branched-chain amino acid aminotransferase